MTDRSSGPFQLVILVLSIYVLVAMVAEVVFELQPDTVKLLHTVDDLICLIFLADFAVRFARAESKWQFMRWGWIDLVSSIPMFETMRWGRAVRILRILRMLRAIRSARVMISFFAGRRTESALATVTLLAVSFLIGSSLAILAVEKHPDAKITTAADALWWALTTMTTVGYGDIYPVTQEGRIVAGLLMVGGVGLFGALTALLASVILGPRRQDDLQALLDELKAMRARLDALESRGSDLPRQGDETGREDARVGTRVRT